MDEPTQTDREDLDVWFWGFVKVVQDRIPDNAWPPVAGEGDLFWNDLKADFRRLRVTRHEANRTSQVLRHHPPRFVKDFPPAFKKTLEIVRERAASEAALARPFDPRLRSSHELSKDCPECEGTGWAKRHTDIPSLPHLKFAVSLACRCPMGRVRLGQCREKDIECEDLQAEQWLWDENLSHPTWFDEPTKKRT